MKIAFFVSPDSNLLDLLLVSEPLRAVQSQGGMPDGVLLVFISDEDNPFLAKFGIPTVPASPLADDDFAIVTGSAMPKPADLSRAVRWAVLGQTAAQLPVDALKAATRNEVTALGFKICESAIGREATLKTAALLGYPAEWAEKFLARPRQALVSRKTKETVIDLSLSLDGSGKAAIETGIPFFDHMLTQIAVHGLFDLSIRCQGDLQVDAHHTVEDVGLALGKAFDQALGDRKGLVRMASAVVPMDESLAQVSLDFSGRPYAVVQADWLGERVGDLPVTLISHFLESFATQARCNLAVRLLAGGDEHHRAEAIFKALARALDGATQIDPRRLNAVPSSKGVL